ncbi:uncharacterized protein [Aegilops tauschii subsp. strangulata]|uniref:uncharacterized protein n=1 Tax=Aegilops tauschii subsp. strangulata TaxID=200361 RepID=UPI00098B3321|nr:uncharacterized protein LOC109752901 [Aegilops tauschii subsp. strangulata]
MATSAAEGRFSSLPDDLLHTVYARLAGPVDRVRFAAVCASWRAVVASTHPPRLPWLILDPSGRDKEKHVYGLADGVVLPRFTFPTDAVGGRFVGGHGGGWAAFLDDEQLRIVNLFSGAEVALSPTQRTRCARDPFVPQKVIFSEPPALSGCILAAITDKYGVAIRGLARSERAWRSRFTTREVMDIAFCNGDLYCIMSCTKQIVKFEVGLDECGFAVFKSDPQCLVIHNQWDMDRLYLGAEGDPDAHAIYIVELRGKLAMVVRRTGGPRLCSRNISGPFFLVFELVDADINRATPHCWYKWKEVTSLGDQALFLGPTCSKAMHLLSTSEYGGPRRNHIYYSHRRCYTRKERLPDDTKEFLTSSNIDGTHVYFKEDERVDDDVEGITSVGYYVVSGAQAHPPMWVLPPDV